MQQHSLSQARTELSAVQFLAADLKGLAGQVPLFSVRSINPPEEENSEVHHLFSENICAVQLQIKNRTVKRVQ